MLWRKRCGRIRGRVVQEIATVLGLMYRVTNDFGENVVFLTLRDTFNLRIANGIVNHFETIRVVKRLVITGGS